MKARVELLKSGLAAALKAAKEELQAAVAEALSQLDAERAKAHARGFDEGVKVAAAAGGQLGGALSQSAAGDPQALVAETNLATITSESTQRMLTEAVAAAVGRTRRDYEARLAEAHAAAEAASAASASSLDAAHTKLATIQVKEDTCQHRVRHARTNVRGRQGGLSHFSSILPPNSAGTVFC
jgi:hypothetical protein